MVKSKLLDIKLSCWKLIADRITTERTEKELSAIDPALELINTEYRSASLRGCHVYRGIEWIGEALYRPVKILDHSDDMMTKVVDYCGFRFFQLIPVVRKEKE